VEPDKAATVMQAFAGVDAYTLGDAARRRGTGGVIHAIKPQTGAIRFTGRALTARVEYQPNGNIPLSQYGGAALLDRVSSGDVLLLDVGGRFLSALGDLAFATTQRRGGVGIVVNGAVRDIEDADPEFPIFSLGVAISSVVNRAFITGIGEPVFIDGIRIATGDIVAGCRGGIVTVPWAEQAGVLAEALQQLESDRRVREGIARGDTMADLWKQHKSTAS